MPSRFKHHQIHLMNEMNEREEGKSQMMGSDKLPSAAPGAVHSLADFHWEGGLCSHFADKETRA